MNKYNVTYKSTDGNTKTVQIVARNIEDAFSSVKEDYTDVAELFAATVVTK